MQAGRLLVVVGIALVIGGLLFMAGDKLGLGRLPGDIVVRKKNVTFYMPIVSSIVVSVVLTLLFNLMRK